MNCPHCDHPSTSVLRTEDGGRIRRRECRACRRRWTTHEITEVEAHLLERAKQMTVEFAPALIGGDA